MVNHVFRLLVTFCSPLVFLLLLYSTLIFLLISSSSFSFVFFLSLLRPSIHFIFVFLSLTLDFFPMHVFIFLKRHMFSSFPSLSPFVAAPHTQRRSRHRNQEEYIDKRGIHVVVGHYLGDDIPGKTTPNLTAGKTNYSMQNTKHLTDFLFSVYMKVNNLGPLCIDFCHLYKESL